MMRFKVRPKMDIQKYLKGILGFQRCETCHKSGKRNYLFLLLERVLAKKRKEIPNKSNVEEKPQHFLLITKIYR